MERSLTAQEIVAGIWRRKKLVAAITVTVFAAGAALVAALPSTYRASAVVRVEPTRPSEDLVQPSVTQLIEDRLKTVRHELLARPILETVIKELDLFPELRRKRGMEAAVAELRRDLDVQVEGENAFELSVEGNDPETVARIANRIPALFAEQALEVRERQARMAAALFDDELNRIGAEVQRLEAEITEFKLQHLGELPEQLEANMRGLERVVGLITARHEARRELLRRASDLEAAAYAADTEVGRLRRSVDEITRAAVNARSQWTADHPEVQRLEREMETVQSRQAAAEARARADNAERRSLRSQIRAVDEELKRLEADAAMYRQRLDNTPKWGQQLSILDRDYEMMRTKYQSLLSRKVEAEVARDLEARARSGMFHVLSAASPPSSPLKPDRVAGMALALIAALGLGMLAAIFKELQDDSLRRIEHARELSVPVLAVVPTIPGGAGRRGGGRAGRNGASQG